MSLSYHEWREQDRHQYERAFAIMMGMIIVLVLVAVFGVLYFVRIFV